MLSQRSIRDLVQRVVGQVLAERGRSGHPAGQPERRATAGVHVDLRAAASGGAPLRPEPAGAPAKTPRDGGRGPELVTAACFVDSEDGSVFRVPMGACVTPLAREEAWRRRIRLVEGSGVGSRSGVAGRVRIAIGADHGGFETKQRVIEWLGEAGYPVHDFGTHDKGAVDYPDFAQAVAEAVANGSADLGICVDGAGIGSAMAANKVPGVRAANGWNVQSAVNAREHNYANVLTLGGGMLDPNEVLEIVRAFLTTPEGAERHARRVAKIDAIEHRYSRARASSASNGGTS